MNTFTEKYGFTPQPLTDKKLLWTGANFEAIKEFCPKAELKGEFVAFPMGKGLTWAMVEKNEYVMKTKAGNFYPMRQAALGVKQMPTGEIFRNYDRRFANN